MHSPVKVLLPVLVLGFAVGLAAAGPLAEKGKLLLADNFVKLPGDRKARGLAEGWQQRISFGKWIPIEEGGVRAVNVPEHGHGPVMTYLGPVGDVIIECEFMLPKKEGADRHFRIFLDHPDYRGHTIAAWANLTTVFQPLGLTLLHNPKSADKKVLEEARFGPQEVALEPGAWHTMRLELVGTRARVTVGDAVVEGEHAKLATTKNKIALNPGKAGGSLRNFKVWQAVPKKKQPQ
jgi:hypothetical protein